ncbi:hypothetical protein [uncultured Draconibacterium sp.]|uniref:hypothetical protein n=1 Tax=uncultured Draconibacterium sp. TaxID=1573823 RepID=UPI0025E3CE1A|nr:hypothetical protein [uncultured Draconibacterium sp.]
MNGTKKRTHVTQGAIIDLLLLVILFFVLLFFGVYAAENDAALVSLIVGLLCGVVLTLIYYFIKVKMLFQKKSKL